MVILRYLEDSPLVNFTKTVTRAVLNTDILNLQDVVRDFKTRFTDVQTAEGELLQALDDAKKPNAKVRYVKNNQSGLTHQALLVGLDLPPVLWKTTCGWSFATSSYSFPHDPELRSCNTCDKCFPEYALADTDEEGLVEQDDQRHAKTKRAKTPRPKRQGYA